MARDYGTPSAMTKIAFDPLQTGANALRRFDNVAAYGLSGAAVIGAVVFESPMGFANHMQVFEVVGFNYASGKMGFRFTVSFYTTTAPAITYPCVCYDTGVPGDVILRPQVRIGRRIATSNPVIIIGDIASSWSYPKFNLKTAWVTHSTTTDASMDAAPAGVLVTDLSPYDLVAATVNTTPGQDASTAFSAGTLPVARGGTNAGSFTQGGVLYGGSTFVGSSAVGSLGQLMVSGASGAPTWAAADMTTLPQSWVKESVVCATVGNITMSGVAVNVDNIVPSAGQRVLVKDQVLPAENGIYVAAAGAWTRATDAALSSHIAGGTVSVDNGSVNGGSTWTTNFKTTDTLGTTAMVWSLVTTSGERWLAPVKAATAVSPGNITLSGTQTIDGVALVAGDRVLVYKQTTTSENGIYVVAAGAWTRAADADTAAKVAYGTKVKVLAGTQNQQSVHTQLSTVTTIGTDPQDWRQHTQIDYGGMFGYPLAAKGAGHLYFNLNQQAISVWDGLKWVYSSAVLWTCTSATRPGATFVNDGAVIYETDTQQSYVSNGNAWVPFAAPVQDHWLPPIRLATGNHTLSGLAAIDGVTPVAGDRIGAFFQTTTTQNGIYIAAAGAWTRAVDANGTGMARYTKVYCKEGTNNAGKVWEQLNTYNVVGTDVATWRVKTMIDYVNAFSMPPPTGIGHVVWDSNSNMLIGWTGGAWVPLGGVQIVTSTTRPGGVVTGAIIYETDTGLSYIWNAGAWVPYGGGGGGGSDLTAFPSSWTKQDARVATTANITLSGTQTIDGIAVVAGDRVLVKNQTTTSQNGIYVVAAGAWTRATDADSTGEIAGAMISIDYGTLNGGTTWTTTFKASDTIGTTAMVWGPVGAPAGGTSGYLLASGGAGAATWAVNDLTALPTAWTKQDVVAATTANITLSAAQTVDGVAVVVGNRVLVKNQNTASQNGIYTVAAGAWTRTPDADAAAEIAGAVVNVGAGTVNGGGLWTTSFKSTDTLGTTAMVWELVGPEVAVQAAQPTGMLDLWVDTDDYGTAVVAGPLGTVGYAETVVDSATVSSTAVVDNAALTVTITADGTRRYKITVQSLFQSTVAGDRPGLLIREGSTQLNVTTFIVDSANGNYGTSLMHVLIPTAGVHTYKVSYTRSSGSGAVKMSAGAGQPAFILIEDIGV